MWAEKVVSFAIRISPEDFRHVKRMRRAYRKKTGKDIKRAPLAVRREVATAYLSRPAIKKQLPPNLVFEDWVSVFAIILTRTVPDLRENGGLTLSNVIEGSWAPAGQCVCGAKTTQVRYAHDAVVWELRDRVYCPVCKKPRRRLVKVGRQESIDKA